MQIYRNGPPRHLIALLDNQYTCQCRCGGRHTLKKMLDILPWGIRVLLGRVWPSMRHDGSPVGNTDTAHKALNGYLPRKGGLLQVRGVWAWYKQIVVLPYQEHHRVC